MAGEWYHVLYHQVYAIPTTCLRLTNTYGPRMLLKHNRQGFVPWFVRLALLGREIEVFGDGMQKRDLNYVDDAVEALLMVGPDPETFGEIYNLGHDEVVTLAEFVQTLTELCPGSAYRVVPFPEEARRIDIGDYYGDYRKLREGTGWSPRVSLREGLSRTIAYYRQHLERYLE